MDKNFPATKFLESSFTFGLMRENANSDGKQLSGKQGLNYINKLKKTCKTLGSSLSFKDCVVRSTRVRCTSFENDMIYWEYRMKKKTT